jgi:phenylacetate-CoA ligase
MLSRKMSHGGFELEPIEMASVDELRALQLQRLKASVAAAYSVPHYKAKFEAARVHPDDIRTLADISRLPFTTKKDLRDTYPFGLFAVPKNKVVRI